MAAQPQAAPQAGRPQLTLPVRLALAVVQIGIVGGIGYLAPPWKYWPLWISAAGWVAFSQYWALAARNAAQAKSSESSKSRLVHELLLNGGLLLLFVPVPGLRQSFLPSPAVGIAAGLAVQASFCALAIWARRHLGRYWSGRIEIKREHALVRSGPYRLLRHPIYTAMVGMYAGSALVSGQVHALLGVALALIAYWRKVRIEEGKLREAFGAEYEDYRRATWGAVPGLF